MVVCFLAVWGRMGVVGSIAHLFLLASASRSRLGVAASLISGTRGSCGGVLSAVGVATVSTCSMILVLVIAGVIAVSDVVAAVVIVVVVVVDDGGGGGGSAGNGGPDTPRRGEKCRDSGASWQAVARDTRLALQTPDSAAAGDERMRKGGRACRTVDGGTKCASMAAADPYLPKSPKWPPFGFSHAVTSRRSPAPYSR